MAYRAVLFDLDGTLLDTLKDIADAVNIALAQLGFPQHEVEAFKYFVGDGRVALATRSLPKDYRVFSDLVRPALKGRMNNHF